MDELAYSSEDQRNDGPNPSQRIITGDLRSIVASYKSVVQKYARFRQDGELEAGKASLQTIGRSQTFDPEHLGNGTESRVFSMVRDLQTALRSTRASRLHRLLNPRHAA